MTRTLVDTPPPAPAPGHSVGDVVRRVLFHLGELLLTLGVVVLLFVVYEVWITNIAADRNNRRNISAFKHEFDTVLGLPGSANSTVPIGKALGVLYIPRLGRDYAEAIVQGSTVPDDDQLEQGAAHYGNTQLPGQAGNFAVAGHRVGKGEPFLNIDKLRSGDPVIVEYHKPGTSYVSWLVYRVLGTTAGANPQTDTASTVRASGGRSFPLHGREIIEPSDGNVLLPVPDQPSVTASQAVDALMTMTTCHPKFTASHRMILFSKLATTVRGTSETMPAAISALYGES